jgi:hypothetical protein
MELHAPASSNSYCKPMTSIGGTCNTFQRAHGEICCEMKPGLRVQSYGTYSENNLCCGNFVNPYNIIKEDICSGMLGTWAQLPYDRSSQWEELPYDSRPPTQRLPFTFLQTSQEHRMARNHSLNNIPLFNNIGPVEPFEVFQDVDLLLSESLAEKTANVMSVTGGEELQDEEIEKSSTNLYGGEDMELHSELDNLFSIGSCNVEEENEWLKDIFQGQEGMSDVNGGGNTVLVSELEDLLLFDFDLREMPTVSVSCDVMIFKKIVKA